MMGIVSNNNQKYKTLTYVSFIGKSSGFVFFAPVNQDIVQPKRLEIHINNLLWSYCIGLFIVIKWRTIIDIRYKT